jgi:molecular chaperone DnaK
MAGTVLEYYQGPGWKLLESALQLIVGRNSEHAVEEALFRKHVVEAGWAALPDPHKQPGRAALRWDDVLLALRREVYDVRDRKLALRADARQRSLPLLSAVLAGPKPAAPSAQGGAKSAVKPPSAQGTAPRPAPQPASRQGTAPQPKSAQGAPRPAPQPPSRQGAPAPPAAQPRSAQGAAPRPATTPGFALGIDLGTTFSVVAHLDMHGRPTTIQNAHGELLTPSVVLFDTEGVIVGKEAVAAAAMEPDKVAEFFKRDMGAKFYRRKINGWDLPPEAISAFVLRSLRADAERKLGKVNKAVITVPAYFDEMRRQATMTAAKLIDLEVLDIINEPTAAALSYGYQQGFLDRQGRWAGGKPLRIMVYDLGGGTFDVTIVEIDNNSFKAIATDGDVYLGGKDWDDKLVALAADRFKQETKIDPRTDPVTMHELFQGCEVAKRTLSERTKAVIIVNHAGQRLKVEVTRKEFEDATAALLGRTRNTAEIVVRQAGLTWPQIDKVLLVGGATRMPAVVKMIKELAGKDSDRSLSPDEAVAHGAALYADLLLRKQQGTPARFSITNVNSHSLGIVGLDSKAGTRRNQILIPKNTPLPHTVTKVFKTAHPNQRRVTVRVVEGESEKPDECFQIGTASISDLPPNLPLGWPVQVSYSYREDGRLQVAAKLEGHAAAVSTSFQRDTALPDDAVNRWTEYVAREWRRRNQ